MNALYALRGRMIDAPGAMRHGGTAVSLMLPCVIILSIDWTLFSVACHLIRLPLYRIATFYLPPAWGFPAMLWLQGNRYL